MLEIGNPGLMAMALEMDLARFRQARRLVRMPPALEELSVALGRVAAMLREAEERESARRVGVDVVEFGGLRDGAIEYGVALRREITRAIRRERPDLVLARLARMRLRFDRYRKIPLEKIYDPAAIFGR